MLWVDELGRAGRHRHADDRRASGYREYDESAVERLRFIRRAQELGFTLAEISELLALRLDPRTTAGRVKARAEEKIAEIDARLRDLTRLRRALTHLAGRCHGGQGPTGDCPLLEALGPLGDEHETSHAAAAPRRRKTRT